MNDREENLYRVCSDTYIPRNNSGIWRYFPDCKVPFLHSRCCIHRYLRSTFLQWSQFCICTERTRTCYDIGLSSSRNICLACWVPGCFFLCIRWRLRRNARPCSLGVFAKELLFSLSYLNKRLCLFVCVSKPELFFFFLLQLDILSVTGARCGVYAL